MSELHHRIKIFVYRFEDRTPRYLLLKPDQGIEALWGPLQGGLGYGEKMEAAIRRKVQEEVGVRPPGMLMDLEMPGRWTLGDEEIIEWTFGFAARGGVDSDRVSGQFADHRWARFQEAYNALGLDPDRAAMMRLHTKVLSA